MSSQDWGGQATYTINNSGASSNTPVFGHNSVINFSDPNSNVQGIQMVVNA